MSSGHDSGDSDDTTHTPTQHRHTRGNPSSDNTVPTTLSGLPDPQPRRSRSNSPAHGIHTPPPSTANQPPPNPLSTVHEVSRENSTHSDVDMSGSGAGGSGDAGGSLSNIGDGGNTVYSLSDIVKLFDGVPTLTKQAEWNMWSFRVKNALKIISPSWALPAETNPIPQGTQQIVFHKIASCISDQHMVHYTDVTTIGGLMDGLAKRFDPQTSTTEANNVHALFQLRKPVYQLDKLLDEAEQLHSRIIAQKISFPKQVYYYAIVGIIPPAYYHVRTAYEARTTAAAGDKKAEFDPDALILELRNEFTNYRATHPPGTSSSSGPKKDKSNYRGGSSTKGAHANAATPYSKPDKSSEDKDKQ